MTDSKIEPADRGNPQSAGDISSDAFRKEAYAALYSAANYGRELFNHATGGRPSDALLNPVGTVLSGAAHIAAGGLVEQFTSDDFQTRHLAQQGLKVLGRHAEAQLLRGLTHADLEVRQRSETGLVYLYANSRESALGPALKRAASPVDEFNRLRKEDLPDSWQSKFQNVIRRADDSHTSAEMRILSKAIDTIAKQPGQPDAALRQMSATLAELRDLPRDARVEYAERLFQKGTKEDTKKGMELLTQSLRIHCQGGSSPLNSNNTRGGDQMISLMMKTGAIFDKNFAKTFAALGGDLEKLEIMTRNYLASKEK